MTTLIERGAMALLREDAGCEGGWSILSDDDREPYLARSWACLEAFREPVPKDAEVWSCPICGRITDRESMAPELETDT